MADFNPDFTEIIYFDTENYVPPEHRSERSGPISSLVVNPTNPDHFLLGGVFTREFPLKKQSGPLEHFWGFSKEEESKTLSGIYRFFQDSWKMLERKTSKNPDLITVGIGISRVDLPVLFMRSMHHKIDSPERLYETFLKTKVVDLCDAGIPLFTKNPDPVLYPRTANQLASRFGLLDSGRKVSGKSVWDMYDSKEFEGIKERTEHELEIARQIAEKILPIKRI